MKIALLTTPIRPIPTSFPPLGSLAIIQSLAEENLKVHFYNIDFHRYKNDEIKDWISKGHFDVIMISAVVSTAYAYTKWITKLINHVSPLSIVIVGGNLAASAEILLRKCNVQFCVIGDGEITIKHLIKSLDGLSRNSLVKSNFNTIEGIAYINDNNVLQFNGYGEKYNAEEITFPDLKILEADNSLSHYISDYGFMTQNSENGLTTTPRKMMTVISSKGCVARCTFCHRFERGYRPKPTSQVIEYLKNLRKQYGITHIDFGDENFGANRPLTRELAKELGNAGFTWQVAGVRVRTVNSDDLKLWHDNGCEKAYFGIESGSPKMLEIMEKKATVEQNLQALKSVSEERISTVIQLIVGMPGETDQTISETIEFLKKVSDFSIDWDGEVPSKIISVNYAQALPGTPLYEWARENGHIGNNIESEEDYLIKISDTDAYSEDHFVNYTGFPMLKVLTWRPTMLAQIDAYHLSKNYNKDMGILDIFAYYWRYITKGNISNKRSIKNSNEKKLKEGYFNIQNSFPIAPFYMNKYLVNLAYPITAIIVAFWRGGSFSQAIKLIFQHLWWSCVSRKNFIKLEEKTLRKQVQIEIGKQLEPDDMIFLRKGR